VAAGLPDVEIAQARELGRHVAERRHLRKDGTRFLGTTTIAAIRENHGGGESQGGGCWASPW
jgi:two-component system, sensor histidine kinase and response regulator